MAAAESDAEDVVQVSTDNDTTEKNAAVCGLDPQSLTREEVWITIFQVDKVKNPLRAVFKITKTI